MAASSNRFELDDPRKRAEDILLGALGFGETAHIIEITRTVDGFSGVVQWDDGEQINIKNEDALSELEMWALATLVSAD